MGFTAETTKSDSTDKIDDDANTAIISLLARIDRYGLSSITTGKIDRELSNKHVFDVIKQHGHRMHGDYLPNAAKRSVLNKTYLIPVDTLIGRHYFAFQPSMNGKHINMEGIRILPLSSPHGRYFVCQDGRAITIAKYGKALLLVVKSHCLMRMKERGNYSEVEALRLIVDEIIFKLILEKDEEEVHILTGDKSIKVITANIETTYTIKEQERKIQSFAVICYTFY